MKWFLIFFLISFPIIADPLIIHDGDTIKDNGVTIRLRALDAPELKQPCYDKKKVVYCGELSRNALQKLIGDGSTLDCKYLKKDLYGRQIGECYVAKQDVSFWMVYNGWAVAYMSKDYVEYEQDAKKHKRGIWKYQFERPADYRKGKKHDKR